MDPFNSSGNLIPNYSTFPVYYALTLRYFLILSIPSGIISSIMTLIALSSSQVQINKRCRYLYLFDTISECCLIFFKDIITGFLGDGLSLLSDGKVSINLETKSILFCKIFRGCRFSTEVLASYSITIMTVER